MAYFPLRRGHREEKCSRLSQEVVIAANKSTGKIL
jgi:hypothetical protein